LLHTRPFFFCRSFYTKATKEQANQESIEALATKPLYDDATGNNFLQGENLSGIL
jgi:hypothetical protein